MHAHNYMDTDLGARKKKYKAFHSYIYEHVRQKHNKVKFNFTIKTTIYIHGRGMNIIKIQLKTFIKQHSCRHV